MANTPFLLLGTGNRGQVILSGSDFERHKVISGITGSGKSTFLAWLALSLLRQGVAFSLVDPHGDLCRLILQLLLTTDFFSNKKSFDRLWFVDFNRTDAAIPFNVLRGQVDSHSIANNVLEAIHRAFPTVGTTAALDNTFLACCYVLAESNGGRPITEMQRLLLDASYRSKLLKNISDPLVVQFFESKLAEKANSNLIDSSMRRSFLLTFSMQLRNTLGQVENRLNFRDIIDSGRSVLYSLGGLDDQSKRLLGCLLMVGYEQAFLSRASLSPDRRIPHHLIVDEFPLFSASGDSLEVVLSQCRKFLGTLYLAFQNQAQLGKGIAGSLQNAIHIIMKAGVEDSSALVSRFYRPQEDEQASLFTFTSPPSIFSGVTNTTEARMIFENLQRQQAIVTINGKAELLTTPTLPIGKVDHKQLTELEAAYARHLLTPVKDIGKDTASPRLYLVPKSQVFQRRTYQPATTAQKPVPLFVGNMEQDILTALTTFHYLTLDQLITLLGKKEGNKNYLRKKLTDMSSTVAVTLLPRVTGGKPLQVFYLPAAGERKHTFLEHTLDCNEVLISGVLLPTMQPSLTLIDVKSERTLKTLLNTCPCIPDGLLSFQTKTGEIIHIAVEIDRATENRERITEKFTSSSAWIDHLGLDAVTIAFIVTTGDKKRVSWLCDIASEIVTDLADIFLFGCAPGDNVSPSLFTDPVFMGLDGSQHALIEQPF